MKFNRFVAIAACASMAFVFGPGIGYAEEAVQDDAELGEVLVTADRWGSAVENATDRITVMTAEDIEKLPVRDAAEALDYMVGVIVNRTGIGGAGSYSFPEVQGAQSYQTTVLINGIPFNDLAGGYGNIGMIPASMIDRIEVVHGTGGVECGSGQGGVINVITISADSHKKNSVAAGGGNDATMFGDGNFQYWSDTVGISVGAAYRKSDGPDAETSAMENSSGIGSAAFMLGDDHTITVTGMSYNGFWSTGTYRGDYAGFYQAGDYTMNAGGITLDSHFGFGDLRVTGYSQGKNQVTESFQQGEGSLGDFSLDDTILGGSAIFRAGIEVVDLTLGVDARKGTLVSSALGEDEFVISSYGTFGGVAKNIDALSLQAGLRFSDEDVFGTFTGYNVGAKYGFGAVDVRASVAQGYTVPTFHDRYYTDEWVVANPDLGVEQALSYQVGVMARLAGMVTIDINGFYNDVKDLLVEVETPEGLYQLINNSTAIRQGVEAELRFETNGFFAFFNMLSQTTKDGETDEEILNTMRGHRSFGVGYEWGTLFVQITGAWRDGYYSEEQFPEQKVWVYSATAQYGFDLGKSDLIVGVMGNNLTDAEEFHHYLAPLNAPMQVELFVKYALTSI